MKSTRFLLAAPLSALALVAAQPAAAATTTGSSDPQAQVAQATQDLDQAQAKLAALNDETERAQAQVDAAQRKAAADQEREADLNHKLEGVARLSYEQPGLSFVNVIEARSVADLWSRLSTAQLVAHRERSLMDQLATLRRQDEQSARQEQAALVRIQQDQAQATVVASQAEAILQKAQDDAARARAQQLAAQAAATQAAAQAAAQRPAPSPAAAPPPGQWPNRFAFGYCTWYVATRRYIPWLGNAIEWWPNARAMGYPEGQTPQVGAVMVTRESSIGHVAYVEAVNPDGSWTVSEMNYTAWDVVDRRTIHPGQVPLVGFIY